MNQTWKPASQRVRAYRQAPWRVQTRLLAIGLAAVFGVMALLSLYVFAGAQAAEAGLRVQALIRERDAYLRLLSSQEGELARLQSISYLQKRAAELGFKPATPLDMKFIDIPRKPIPDSSFVSPSHVLYVEQPVALPPAYRETLLEWLLKTIRAQEGH